MDDVLRLFVYYLSPAEKRKKERPTKVAVEKGAQIADWSDGVNNLFLTNLNV
jgi:hypothetical protein